MACDGGGWECIEELDASEEQQKVKERRQQYGWVGEERGWKQRQLKGSSRGSDTS